MNKVLADVVAAAKNVWQHLADYEIFLLALAATLAQIQGNLVTLGAPEAALVVVIRDVSLVALILQKVIEARQQAK